MMALPKAMSQGSNGAGGGALTAFTAMSAARAEPVTIASAVANKTTFFMTIPISVSKISPIRRPPPRGQTITGCQPNSLTSHQFGTCHLHSEAKKTSNCRLFRRYGRSVKCCRRVLHSDNNFDRFRFAIGQSGRAAEPLLLPRPMTESSESTEPGPQLFGLDRLPRERPQRRALRPLKGSSWFRTSPISCRRPLPKMPGSTRRRNALPHVPMTVRQAMRPDWERPSSAPMGRVRVRGPEPAQPWELQVWEPRVWAPQAWELQASEPRVSVRQVERPRRAWQPARNAFLRAFWRWPSWPIFSGPPPW